MKSIELHILHLHQCRHFCGTHIKISEELASHIHLIFYIQYVVTKN